jgi:glycine oxidase
MNVMASPSVIIVGGGIIGGSVAFELAQRGARVLVLDRQTAGCEASWAAAGMLTPAPETPDAMALVPLARASMAIYADFVAGVERASGQRASYHREGALVAFFADDAERELSTFLALNHGAGLRAEAVRVEEARRMEPPLSPAARSAAWLPDEGWVDNRALARAVLGAAVARGAEVRAGLGVTALALADGRCTGVIAGGRVLSAQHVVIAAGSFSSQVEDVACYAPTSPARGQMIALRHTGVSIGRAIRSQRGYLVPREDGRILAGSTIERAGYEKGVTPEGLQQVLAAAVQIAPALAAAQVVETWSGLRPDTPDHLPILGPTDVEGLVMATGHYRNGILLAPITAKLIADWILEGKAHPLLEPFSPLRFAQHAAAAQT